MSARIGHEKRAADPKPVVELRGNIADDLSGYARRKVAAVSPTVAHSHVRVVRHADPAREDPVTARATIDLDGTTIQVHADGQPSPVFG